MLLQLLHEFQTAQLSRTIWWRIVVADTGLPRVGDDVQRRVSRSNGVGIGARFEEYIGELVMGIRHCQHQRRSSGARTLISHPRATSLFGLERFVDVGPGLEQ